MTATAFWAWSVAEPKMAPRARLEWALDFAAERFTGVVPNVVYVHPLTAAETPDLEGITFVSRPEVGRFGYWFPTGVKGERGQ